jgi:ABC-type uncharacterized transport system permease subunit
VPSLGTLIVGLAAGIIGMAYFVYGKRAQRLVFVIAGIGLCVYPYLVSGVGWDLLVGSALAAVPFVIRD